MPTKPLDRLMFAQGGLCFFCSSPLGKADARVEHLVPTSRSGSDSDDNCVACCKAINMLLGSMSLKEKIKVVLNQKGNFTCPSGIANPVSASAQPKPAPVPTPARASPTLKPASLPSLDPETIAAVLKNLKSRGNARPRKLKTLKSSIKSLSSLKLTDKTVDDLVKYFSSVGKILIKGEQVTYKL